jgi:hypothetical protein
MGAAWRWSRWWGSRDDIAQHRHADGGRRWPVDRLLFGRLHRGGDCEARDALRAGAARVVRFGVGSPYIDVRLPCGGGST